jgi:glutamate synthase (NADPH/NADH) small chain
MVLGIACGSTIKGPGHAPRRAEARGHHAFHSPTFLWEVLAPDVARAAQPGHFVMLRLREAASASRSPSPTTTASKGTITMVIQALGKTTLRDARPATRGRQRSPTSSARWACRSMSSKVGHVVLVGGGLGVAPVYPQLRAFKQAGNRTTGIIGFRNKALVFWEDRVSPAIATT